MKPSVRNSFVRGNYISDVIEQIPNNIVLNSEVSDCISTACSNMVGITDCEFNLTERINKKPHKTFLIRMVGDSMQKAGLMNGDVVMVNSSVQAVNNSIVVAEYNSTLFVRRIKFLKKRFVLFAENEKYRPITVQKSDNLVIWGVVMTVLNSN